MLPGMSSVIWPGYRGRKLLEMGRIYKLATNDSIFGGGDG
jgi:hypothetical protein